MPANIFCQENVVCLLRLMHIFKCTHDLFYHRSRHYESWSNSLICVHVFCSIDIQSKHKQKREQTAIVMKSEEMVKYRIYLNNSAGIYKIIPIYKEGVGL